MTNIFNTMILDNDSVSGPVMLGACRAHLMDYAKSVQIIFNRIATNALGIQPHNCSSRSHTCTVYRKPYNRARIYNVVISTSWIQLQTCILQKVALLIISSDQ